MEIPEIQVHQVEVPVVRRLEPPVVLTPSIRSLQKPVVQVPTAEIPYYEPIDVPTTEQWKQIVEGQNSQKEKEETQEEKSRQLPPAAPVVPPAVQVPQETQVVTPPPTTNLGVPVIEVPLIGQVPIPPKEQVILAGTTATASVAAALVGKSLVEWMVKKFKPIVEQIFVRGKKLLNRDLTPYELQIYFAFEKSQSLKKVNKLLKKEQKKDKQRQYKEFHSK